MLPLKLLADIKPKLLCGGTSAQKVHKGVSEEKKKSTTKEKLTIKHYIKHKKILHWWLESAHKIAEIDS